MSTIANLKTRLTSIKEKASETMGQVLQTAEVGAAAAGFAWANGRYGALNAKAGNYDPEIDVLGVPADVGAAVVLHGLAFTGLLGKHKEHAHNIGDGALSSYLCRIGMRMGLQAKSTAGQPKTVPNAAAPAVTAGQSWPGTQDYVGARQYQGVG
jgi:hypothetical protein